MKEIQGYNVSNIKIRTSFTNKKNKNNKFVEKIFEGKSYIAVQVAFRQRLNQVRTAFSEKNIELVKNILENNPNLTRVCIENMGKTLNKNLQ